MQVCDRQYENVAVLDGVAADACIERWPRLRKAHDPIIGGGQDLNEKGVVKARRLRSRPADRIVEFDLGDLKKPDRHRWYLATMSIRSLVASSPRL
jgi:hypothetical protein